MTTTEWTTWLTGNSSSFLNVHVVTMPPREPPMAPHLVDAIYEACAWLDLDPPLVDKASVQAARKRLARLHHPDVGGSLEAMQCVNAAADFLLGLR